MHFEPAPVGVNRDYNYDSDEYSPDKTRYALQGEYSGPGTEYREPPSDNKNYQLVLQTQEQRGKIEQVQYF